MPMATHRVCFLLITVAAGWFMQLALCWSAVTVTTVGAAPIPTAGLNTATAAPSAAATDDVLLGSTSALKTTIGGGLSGVFSAFTSSPSAIVTSTASVVPLGGVGPTAATTAAAAVKAALGEDAEFDALVEVALTAWRAEEGASFPQRSDGIFNGPFGITPRYPHYSSSSSPPSHPPIRSSYNSTSSSNISSGNRRQLLGRSTRHVVIRLTTPERVAYEMASTANARHRAIYYGGGGGGSIHARRGSKRRGKSAPTAPPPPPLDYLTNHLANTKQSFIGAVHLWQTVAKPFLLEAMEEEGEEEEGGRLPSSSSLLSPSHRYHFGDSPIAALSCINFDGPRYITTGDGGEGEGSKEVEVDAPYAYHRRLPRGTTKGSTAATVMDSKSATNTTHSRGLYGGGASGLLLSTAAAVAGRAATVGTPEGIFLGAATESVCPVVTGAYHARGFVPPASTVRATMEELLKDVAAVALLLGDESNRPPREGRRGGNANATSHRGPSSPSSLPISLPRRASAAVAMASEVLYWSLGADDYAVGRGRIAQESVLLEALLEEGGEGPAYNRYQPMAMHLGQRRQEEEGIAASSSSSSSSTPPVAAAAVSRLFSKASPSSSQQRAHPQLSGYGAMGRDGHSLIVPRLTPHHVAASVFIDSGFNSKKGVVVMAGEGNVGHAAVRTILPPLALAEHNVTALAEQYPSLGPSLPAPIHAALAREGDGGEGGMDMRSSYRAVNNLAFIPHFMSFADGCGVYTAEGEPKRRRGPPENQNQKKHHPPPSMLPRAFFTMLEMGDMHKQQRGELAARKKKSGTAAAMALSSTALLERLFPSDAFFDRGLAVRRPVKAHLPVPYGHKRGDGRALLEAYYGAKWRVMTLTSALVAAAEAGDVVVIQPNRDDGGRGIMFEVLNDRHRNTTNNSNAPLRAVQQQRKKKGAPLRRPRQCAPIALTSPKCHAVLHDGDEKETDRTASYSSSFNQPPSLRSGRDHYVQHINGPENRARQVPIVLDERSAIMATPPPPPRGRGRSSASEPASNISTSSLSLSLSSSSSSFSESPSPVYTPTSERLDQPIGMVERLIATVHNERSAVLTPRIGLLAHLRREAAALRPPAATTTGGGGSPAFSSSSSSSSSHNSSLLSSAVEGDAAGRGFLITVAGDYANYQPYLDPASPTYRRILCATYTYHKNIMPRAVLLHEQGAHLCDKHLLFTDKPVTDAATLARLNRGKYVVVALNTPMGEDYMNMWQKTRMILERLEMLVRGHVEHADEEGANDPSNPTRHPSDPIPTSPLRVPSSMRKAITVDLDDEHAIEAAARAVLPHYAGYDFLLLSGDDVCMNLPKMRRYLSEVDELYSVAVPSLHTYAVPRSAAATNDPFAWPSFARRDGSERCMLRSRRNTHKKRSSDSTMMSTAAVGSHAGSSSPSPHPSSAVAYVPASFTAYYRAATTPHHIGYSHRHFISGATYIMNRQGYSNFISAGYNTFETKGRTFAEDVLMGWCHRDTGTIHRNAAAYGTHEEVMNCVGIDYITGMVETIHQTYWLNEYKRRVVPRGGVVTSRDAFQHHFCAPQEMMAQSVDMFGVNPSVSSGGVRSPHVDGNPFTTPAAVRGDAASLQMVAFSLSGAAVQRSGAGVHPYLNRRLRRVARGYPRSAAAVAAHQQQGVIGKGDGESLAASNLHRARKEEEKKKKKSLADTSPLPPPRNGKHAAKGLVF